MADEREVWLIDNGGYWKAAWRDADGKQHGRSLGSKNKISARQARVRCRQIARDLELGDRRGSACPRVSEWFAQYVKSRTDVSPSTLETYNDFGLYLRTYFDNDPPLEAVTRADAADWLDAMTGGELTLELNRREAAKALRGEPARKYRPLSLATVRRHVRTAKLIFGAAADRDYILYNPFDRLVGAPPKVRKTWASVTHADTGRILEACPNAGWRMLFALCRYAGMRRGEALELEWGDVDWAGNRISVNARIAKVTTKRAPRITPIEPPRCPTGLTALMLEARDAAADGERLICAGVYANNIRRTALGILRRAGIPTYAKPFHTLRKNRATELALEYPQGVVMEWLGHDEDVSREFYQRVPDELYSPQTPSVQIGSKRPRTRRETTAKRPPPKSPNPLPDNT